MDHVAIMEKTGTILEWVIARDKTVETRWTIHRKTPYNNIHAGDTIYFKNAGKPVIAKARVKDALFFSGLDRDLIQDILSKYGRQAKMSFREDYESVKDKNYCTLVFLQDVVRVSQFSIDKRGFGIGSAWITLPDIKKIQMPY